jgi:CheY-like chemotaxis protein
LLCLAGFGQAGRNRKSHDLIALVVDDSMLIRHTVCRFLEERGFQVESATNGCEALEILQRIRPDLIITDMQMPKMTGGELITALKQQPNTANIPIVIVAGKQSGFDRTEKRANCTIFKDIDIETQLAKALQSLPGSKIKAKASAK